MANNTYFPLFMRHTTTQNCELQFVKYGHGGWCKSLSVRGGYEFSLFADGHLLGKSSGGTVELGDAKSRISLLKDLDTPYMIEALPPHILKQVVAINTLQIEFELALEDGETAPGSVEVVQEWICPVNRRFQPLMPSALMNKTRYSVDDFERFLATDPYKLPPIVIAGKKK